MEGSAETYARIAGALVLAPEWPTRARVIPVPVVALALSAWLPVKGVDVEKGKAKAGSS